MCVQVLNIIISVHNDNNNNNNKQYTNELKVKKINIPVTKCT